MRVGYLFLPFFFSTIFFVRFLCFSVYRLKAALLTVRRPTTAVKHHLNTDENVLGRSFPQSFPIIMLRQMVDRNRRREEFFENKKKHRKRKKTMNKIFFLENKGIAKNKYFVGSGLMLFDGCVIDQEDSPRKLNEHPLNVQLNLISNLLLNRAR